MKEFHVTMQPKTRAGYKPIEVVFNRVHAQQALHDAIKSVGLSKQEDFSMLEIMENVGGGKYRVAYFDHNRAFTSDYDITLPIRLNIPLTEEQVLKLNATPVKDTTPTVAFYTPNVAEKVVEKILEATMPEEDDFKDTQYYEVSED